MGKRLLCLLLAALMLCSVPPSGAATNSVCFTAVNDTLLPLADETMPFYSDGVLYVASMAFEGTDLGIFYSRSRDKSSVVLYKKRNVIIFDLGAGTIETNTGESYSGFAITRGDVVFLPVDVMCDCFDLNYSYSRISLGYLLRVKSDTVVLSDAKFIDAATSTMSSRYTHYLREQEETAVPTPTTPTTPTEPVEQPTVQEPTPVQEPPQETVQRTVYFVIACTDAAKTAPLLSRLSDGAVTILFQPDGIDGADALLRCLASGGGGVALRIDATGGTESTVAQIEAGNRALWRAANQKTRLIWLDGATEETARRVTEEGYCLISAALDLGDAGASVSRMSASILSAADKHGGRCCVYLGTDTEVSGSLSALLVSLRAGNCTPVRINEVNATR